MINQAGLDLIKTREKCNLETYLDSEKIPTCCYGHTEPEVMLGQTYTQAQCDLKLLEDLKVTENAIWLYVKIPLNQNQTSALQSFIFNIGQTAFANSTLLHYFNQKNYQRASQEMLRWVHGARGEILPGLVTRRKQEQALFLKPE